MTVSSGSRTISGERFFAIIIEGYKLAKSSAATGVMFMPFYGSGTYAPGYFL